MPIPVVISTNGFGLPVRAVDGGGACDAGCGDGNSHRAVGSGGALAYLGGLSIRRLL